MLFEELVILGYISVIKVSNAKIEKDIKKKGEVENYEVKTIISGTHGILNPAVNAKYPTRLNQKIKKKNQNKMW